MSDARVTAIEKVKPSGWSLNMLVVRLDDGGVLVHSPTWEDETTFERVAAIGEPRILFAPNHFHHMSLKRFAERWPRARVVAGSRAIARIARKSGIVPRPVIETEDLLPRGARWLECDGVATGETWLALDGGELLVSDSFFNVTREVTGFEGFMLRAMKTLPNLVIGSTFLMVGVRDARTYREWALAAIERIAPNKLWVSHGDAVEGDDLAEHLSSLVRARV
jgi:hypothetical protein